MPKSGRHGEKPANNPKIPAFLKLPLAKNEQYLLLNGCFIIHVNIPAVKENLPFGQKLKNNKDNYFISIVSPHFGQCK